MIDQDLFVSENQRPTITPGASFTTWTLPETFPVGFATYLDLQVAVDYAKASPLYANFRIATSFDNVAGNFLRFAVVVDDAVDPTTGQATFANVLTNPELIVARSHDIASSGLLAGTQTTIAMPPLSDLTRATGEGRRFLGLAIQALVPTTDWSAGGITAFFSPHPLPQYPAFHRSGH